MTDSNKTNASSVMEKFLSRVEIIDIDNSGMIFSADTASKGFAFVLDGVKCIFTDSFINCLLSYRQWWTQGEDDIKSTILKLAGSVQYSGEITEIFFDYYRYDGEAESNGFISVGINGDYENKQFFDAKKLTPCENPFTNASDKTNGKPSAEQTPAPDVDDSEPSEIPF